MRVAYVYERDAASADVQSGRPASILREFESAGHEVERCFPLPVQKGHWDRIEQDLAKRFGGRRLLGGRSTRHLKDMARQATALLERRPYDFLFCPGTLPIAYLRSQRPITFNSDATFRQMIDYYPAFSRLAPWQIRACEVAERAALGRSALLVYASDWAASSAVQDYHIPEARVAVIPSGAIFGADNQPGMVQSLIESRTNQPLEILFVGKDWDRKGGSICLEAINILRARGVVATLHIVGCNPTIPESYSGFVRSYGPLRASVETERQRLETLFAKAHLLFVPSRAEAFGLVFCEANAFGLPCISTATGGIPTIIKVGINGVLLSPAAKPAEYADEIAALWSDRERYRTLSHGAYREFRTRLNWKTWMDRFLGLIDPLLRKP